MIHCHAMIIHRKIQRREQQMHFQIHVAAGLLM